MQRKMHLLLRIAVRGASCYNHLMNNQLDFKGPKQNSDAASQSAALFVSLYVVILAFFILLTANSQFDAEKTESVMDSVNKAFAMQVQTDTTFTDPSVGDEMSVQMVFDDIQQSVMSLVPMKEMDILTDGNRMVMTMETDSLFYPTDRNIRQDRAEFFDRLVQTLGKWQDDGSQIAVHFLQTLERQAAEDMTAQNQIEVARAGNFARTVENRGIAPENVRIGIHQGDAQLLHFEFIVQTFNPARMKPSTSLLGGEAP